MRSSPGVHTDLALPRLHRACRRSMLASHTPKMLEDLDNVAIVQESLVAPCPKHDHDQPSTQMRLLFLSPRPIDRAATELLLRHEPSDAPQRSTRPCPRARARAGLDSARVPPSPPELLHAKVQLLPRGSSTASKSKVRKRESADDYRMKEKFTVGHVN